ncbi:MAG TPA: enoyl-CoA hydratase/isomerase family protein [Caulobacteraceae bacterium]|nr:enoyl-CoA hydratase/isomerase family protein [Caulobacteraceae bacterium]
MAAETKPDTPADGADYGGLLHEALRVRLHEPGIVVVTLTAPKRMNAFNQAMKRDLIELMNRVQMDDAVRVVVFTGDGLSFCAGDQMGGYQGEAPASVPKIAAGHSTGIGTVNALRVYSQALNLAVRNLDKMTIAAINGPAIQTGLSLALACDFRIGSTRARLGSATLRFALLPDEGGQFLLVEHLGLARALDFCLRKRIVDADEAKAMGLLNEVVAPEGLMDAAMDLARELAEGPQVAMRLLKRSLYVASEASLAQAFEDIAVRTAVTDHHPDARDGARAFIEKRKPRFNAWLEEGKR